MFKCFMPSLFSVMTHISAYLPSRSGGVVPHPSLVHGADPCKPSRSGATVDDNASVEFLATSHASQSQVLPGAKTDWTPMVRGPYEKLLMSQVFLIHIHKETCLCQGTPAPNNRFVYNMFLHRLELLATMCLSFSF